MLGATKVLFEEKVGASWSAYTDHNPVEVRLSKGWDYRAPPRVPRRLRRPNWLLLRGSSGSTQTAREALSTELDRRVGDEPPTTWSELVTVGIGVARAVLGEEPKRDVRPWVRGCESELSVYDQAVSRASIRKRQAETWEEWSESVAEVRRCKRRHLAWIRAREVGVVG